ncbi:MAG: LEA type 2 family protein [Bacteroidia bacterium]|nr:LEA type 2 family protein [Bacteroidia bacterium]
MKKIIYFISVLAVFSSCKMNFEAPKVSRTDDFKITKMTPQGIEAEITVNIKNPNDQSFKIYRSYFDLTYQGIALGRAYMHKKVKVPANSDQKHTFVLKGSLKGVSMEDMTKLMNGKAGTLEIDGKLKAGKWFYKKKFDVKHKQKISLSK